MQKGAAMQGTSLATLRSRSSGMRNRGPARLWLLLEPLNVTAVPWLQALGKLTEDQGPGGDRVCAASAATVCSTSHLVVPLAPGRSKRVSESSTS